MYIFLAFLLVPIVEIALFIQVGGAIGLWSTLGIVVATAFLGTWLVRSQGRMAIARLGGAFSDLRDPAEPLADGAMILFAGALLLTPGFFTDAIGFALLTPGVRRWLFTSVRRKIKVQSFRYGPQPQSARPARHDIIDGDFEVVNAPSNQPKSGWTKGDASGH